MKPSSAVRRIAVVTGSRADYSYLQGIMAILQDDPRAQLQVMVTGMHLEVRFGETWRAIEGDGFEISARVETTIEDDTELAISRSAGRGLIGFAEALDRLRPDLVVLMGDRYEILPAASAAMLMGVPIAHVNGGEATEGAVDDAIRHAITKMARLHFVAAEPYRKRVVQMGEHPRTVFNVGVASLDRLLAEATKANRHAVETKLGLPTRVPFLLVTLHPESIEPEVNSVMVEALLEALDRFPGHHLVFTGVNSDVGNTRIAAAIEAFVATAPARARIYDSLGTRHYAGALRYAEAVVGNSSSGIAEAPVLGTPTVNIGNRQAGRLRAASVVDCGRTVEDIAAAVQKVLDPSFREVYARQELPYGRGGTCNRIVRILLETDFRALRTKRFFDIAMTLSD